MSNNKNLISTKLCVENSKVLSFYNVKDIVYSVIRNGELSCFFTNGNILKLSVNVLQVLRILDQNDFIKIGEQCLINPNQIKSIRNNERICSIISMDGKAHKINIGFEQITRYIDVYKY